MKKTTIVILSLILLSACENKNEKEKVKVQNIALDKSPDANADIRVDEPVGNSDVSTVRFAPPVVKPDKEVTRKVIKEGDIHFESNNVANTRKVIYDQLTKLNGYVSGESESNNSESNQKEYTINAKISAKNFDLFLNKVSENAIKVDSKNISMRDVTTEYIDMTTRLANKKKLEERYLELLKKGDKIADLLQIESKLTEIRSDIESTQGQLNYLSKQIDYSALDITFYDKQTVKESGQTFGYKITNALAKGWTTLGLWFFGLIGSWPLLLIATILIIAFRKWRANIRKKKGKA